MKRVLAVAAASALWGSLVAFPAAASHGGAVTVLTLPAPYAKRLLEEGRRPVFVDLRPAAEFAQGRVSGIGGDPP